MSSPRSKGPEPHIRLPSLGVLSSEDEPLGCLALKTSRPYLWGSQRATGNRDPALKEHTQNFSCSESQHRGSGLKGAWVRWTCSSWSASWRGAWWLGQPWDGGTRGDHSRELTLPHGHQHWQAPFWRPPFNLFVPEVTCSPAGWHQSQDFMDWTFSCAGIGPQPLGGWHQPWTS